LANVRAKYLGAHVFTEPVYFEHHGHSLVNIFPSNAYPSTLCSFIVYLSSARQGKAPTTLGEAWPRTDASEF